MERIYREGDDLDSVSEGDIVEISSGIFVKVKEIKEEIVEDLAGIVKTSFTFKSEIISNVTKGRSKIEKDQILQVDLEGFF